MTPSTTPEESMERSAVTLNSRGPKLIQRVAVYYAGVCGPEEIGGHGAYAYAVYLNEELLWQETFYDAPKDPELTWLKMEYRALVYALTWLLNQPGGLHLHHISLNSDEINTVEQLSGRWKPKNTLYRIYAEAKFLKEQCKDIRLNWLTNEHTASVRKLAQEELSKRGVALYQRQRNGRP